LQQVKYVVELARALAMMPEVYRVDLFTRQICSPDVDWSYGEPTEMLGMGSYDESEDVGESSGAYIVRIPCGPRYFALNSSKESAWLLFLLLVLHLISSQQSESWSAMSSQILELRTSASLVISWIGRGNFSFLDYCLFHLSWDSCFRHKYFQFQEQIFLVESNEADFLHMVVAQSSL